MSIFVLGPDCGHDEPAPLPPAPAGRIGVTFGSPPTSPGGGISLVLGTPKADAAAWPVAVHAFWVPKGSEPKGPDRTPEWFLGNAGLASVHIPVPPDHAEAALSGVAVGLAPGLYFVQTVLEYAS